MNFKFTEAPTMVFNEFPNYRTTSKKKIHPKKSPFQRTTLDIINLNKLCLSEKVVADTGLFNVDDMIFFFFGATLKSAHANNDHVSDTTSFKLIMSRLGRAKTHLSPSLRRCPYE